jgi:hypothetical protein
MISSTWSTQTSLMRTRFPKFRVRKYSDSKVFGWLHHNFFRWAAATTIGFTIYFDNYHFETDRGVEILKHEAVHMHDYARWGLLFSLSYIFLLPVVFTMRAYWEWRGYQETLRSIHEEYKYCTPEYYKIIMDHHCQWVAGIFFDYSYLWMFPFKTYMYNKCKKFVATLS